MNDFENCNHRHLYWSNGQVNHFSMYLLLDFQKTVILSSPYFKGKKREMHTKNNTK